MATKASHLAGFLISSSTDERDVRRTIEQSPAVSPLNTRTLWFYHYIYETVAPIAKVDDPLAEPPFRHEVLICEVSKGFLALGVRHYVISHLLDWEIAQRLQVPWRRARISIQEVIRERLEFDVTGGKETVRPVLAEYDVSHIAAQTESFRGLVRRISMWGDNVMYAPPFRDHATRLECTSCTLKNETGEILTIGSDGYVSFYLPGGDSGQANRLREVMAILKTLHESGLLSF